MTLTEKPSDGGVYSDVNIDRDRLERLQDPEVRAQVETALRGTGISSSVVVARMETGALNPRRLPMPISGGSLTTNAPAICIRHSRMKVSALPIATLSSATSMRSRSRGCGMGMQTC